MMLLDDDNLYSSERYLISSHDNRGGKMGSQGVKEEMTGCMEDFDHDSEQLFLAMLQGISLSCL